MLSVTDAAASRIAEEMERESKVEGSLRIYIQGGGCSGFQYRFIFDEPRELDEVKSLAGFKLLIDPLSQVFLDGASVDYVDGPSGAGFRITNPNVSGSCGCDRSSAP